VNKTAAAHAKPSNYSIPETLVFYNRNDFVSQERATIVQATLNALQSEPHALLNIARLTNIANMSIPALRFRQLVKRYAGTPVLDGVDLDVRAGECLGLAGVNGAGKTSLLKCLFDFVRVDSGSIDIFGRGHREPLARSPLAFLPERFMPPYYLSGAEFLTYMARLHGHRHDIHAAHAMLDALDLDHAALSMPVRKHSKGMTQKLGLAACFLANKQAYVLDEPMSGLDPKARARFKERLRHARNGGATVFFSSHALADIEELCDRMAILHGGRLRFVGTPAACRDAYGAATLEQAFLACVN
jgi:ABC-2 type transport system ATP-binding protein